MYWKFDENEVCILGSVVMHRFVKMRRVRVASGEVGPRRCHSRLSPISRTRLKRHFQAATGLFKQPIVFIALN